MWVWREPWDGKKGNLPKLAHYEANLNKGREARYKTQLYDKQQWKHKGGNTADGNR